METSGAQRGRQRATERAERAGMAWRARAGGPGEPHTIRTSHGEVVLESVEECQEGGLTWLEVRVGGETEGGDPHFRVINPPLLVQDPEGDVEVRGKRYREDPVAALAEVIGSNGGALATRRRTHGR